MPTSPPPRRILMIALDAADPVKVEQGIADGSLPNLRALRERGVHGRLQTSAKHIGGSPWPTFYTGTQPTEHGLYADYQWRHEAGELQAPTPDWVKAHPFWRRLPRNVPVVAYDVPFIIGLEPYHGTELTCWATHDKLSPPASSPPELIEQVRSRFGHWPMSYEGYGRSTIDEHQALREEMLENLRKSTELAVWMLDREWRFAIVCLSALHRAGHRLSGRSSLKGEASDAQGALFDGAMDELYRAADAAVGRLVAAAGDAEIVVFSVHGMEPNNCRNDLLEDMLPRVLAAGKGGEREVGIVRRLGELLPDDVLRAITKRIPEGLRNRLMTIWSAGGVDWSTTKAFTLRADLQGYVRINLSGREPHGIVQPGPEYDALCRELVEGLESFVDSRTGERIVDEVVRVEDVYPEGPARDRLPDLLVLWRNSDGAPHDAIVSQRYGRIERRTPGRIPNARSANHRDRGMLIWAAPDLPRGGMLAEEPQTIDLPPTILARLGLDRDPALAGRTIPELICEAVQVK